MNIKQTVTMTSTFYPFDKPEFRKNGVESEWSVTDREDIAITMAMENAPHDVAMEEFTDLAFTFVTSFLYYTDYDKINEQSRNLYRQGISAFGGISPTYRIALEKDVPVQALQQGFYRQPERE